MAETLDGTMDANTFLIHLRRNRLLALAAALILIQAFFLGWWVWRETMARGRVIRVPLAVYDPRDLLRGQYMNLAYQFEQRSAYAAESGDAAVVPGSRVHAILRRDAKSGLFKPFVYHRTAAEAVDLANALLRKDGGAPLGFRDLEARDEAVIIRGRADNWWRFTFGGNRLFVPEGTEEPPRSGAVAILVVTPSGRIRVEGLEIGGKRWRP